MCKKLICLAILAFVLGSVRTSLAAGFHPRPVAWWKFDGDALDSSGHGHHGTLMGDPAPVFADGVFGQALDTTEPDGPGYVVITGFDGILGGNPFSITAWINTSDTSGTFIGWGSTAGGSTRFEFRPDTDELRVESSGNVQGLTTLPNNEWIHIAVTVKANAVIDDPDVTLYLNGQDDTDTSTGSQNALEMAAGNDVTIARRHTSGRWFDALIDDVRIYGVELTQQQVQDAMAGVEPTPPGVARDPAPEDEATDVPRTDVVLSWMPGDYAPAINGHTVYFSENLDDVNSGVGGITQSATSYTVPQRLELGTTYYWRVDEVNAPPDSTVHRGEVWSFTTEPVGYPIDRANIIATASSVGQADYGPEKTIDGSGLDANDLHSTEAVEMWLSDSEPLGAWIQYEFDRVYKFHEMWVWNSNQQAESLIGFGARDVTVEYSPDGTEWITLADAPEFARAPGAPGYAHDTTVDLGDVAAQYVRLTLTSNWGGLLPQYGLSEVRFFYVPVTAREPSPGIGATDAAVNGTLSWRAGREAATHGVYFSADEQAVIDGNVPVATVADASYSPSPLDLASTYFWRVDEVNEIETPTMWQGNVWAFTTQQSIAVDDFESYNDIVAGEEGSNLVYLTWIDGFDNPATNGSTMGYALGASMETNTTHGGDQSAPMEYNNTTAAFSEVTRTLATQNWTASNVQTLSLSFAGAGTNMPGQLYLKVNGVQVNYGGDAANLTLAGWQSWNIDLASIGTNLSSITSLAIGVQGPGATGTLLIDDIRLHPYPRELITPVQPDATSLVLHYEFEGNADDSTGANPGTAFGGALYFPGKIGQAITLDGLDDYVAIDNLKYDSNDLTEVSVCAWIRTSLEDNQLIVAFDRNEYYRLEINGDGAGPGEVAWDVMTDTGQVDYEGSGGSSARVDDGQWHHVAGTFDNGKVTLYIDGAPQVPAFGGPTYGTGNTRFGYVGLGSESTTFNADPRTPANYFNGSVDDVRIYHRALTDAEVAGLAGRTQSFDKPF